MGSESDQLVRDVLDGVLVEPEFLAQPPIADPLLRAQQACDEGYSLRECYDGVPPPEPPASETAAPKECYVAPLLKRNYPTEGVIARRRRDESGRPRASRPHCGPEARGPTSNSQRPRPGRSFHALRVGEAGGTSKKVEGIRAKGRLRSITLHSERVGRLPGGNPPCAPCAESMVILWLDKDDLWTYYHDQR